MTSPEPRLPVPEDDALDAAASAVVDGVATPEEAALVAAAPDGPRRVAAMRAVAAAVGSSPGGPSAAAADQARAAALAALGAEEGDDGEAGGGTPLTRLPQAPPVGRPGRNLHRLGAIAAALLVVLGIGAFVTAVLSSDSDSQDTFTSAAPTREPAAAGPQPNSLDAADPSLGLATTVPSAARATQAAPPAGGAAGAGPAPAAAPAAGAPPVVNGGDLGRQDEVEALAQRAGAALDGVPEGAVAARDAALPVEVQACAAAASALPGEQLGPLRYRALGTFQGMPAVFLAYDRFSNPPRLLLVLARSDCSVLASTHF